MKSFLILAQQDTSASGGSWYIAWFCGPAAVFRTDRICLRHAGRHHRPSDHERSPSPATVLPVVTDFGGNSAGEHIHAVLHTRDDIRELKNCGLATLLISGVLLAVWTAGSSITSEIEGKTAMTLLSKPINRRQFIVGKYIGILQAVLWLFLPLALMLSFLIFYKVGYDQRETSKEISPWFQDYALTDDIDIPVPHATRLAAVSQVLPGVVLSFFQVSVLAAISVAVATRLPMVVNLVVCFAVFVVGNLTPMMVTQGKTVIQNEFVTFVARLIATILPSLNSFDIYGALARGGSVPPSYLGVCLLYGTAYATATILVAFILFEDRDLA